MTGKRLVLPPLAVTAITTVALFLAASQAWGAGGNLPWEGPLERVLNSATGPIARVGGIVAVVATGLGIAFTEGGGLMRKAVCIVFGLSICFAATTFIADFLGYAGGAGF